MTEDFALDGRGDLYRSSDGGYATVSGDRRTQQRITMTVHNVVRELRPFRANEIPHARIASRVQAALRGLDGFSNSVTVSPVESSGSKTISLAINDQDTSTTVTV